MSCNTNLYYPIVIVKLGLSSIIVKTICIAYCRNMCKIEVLKMSKTSSQQSA